MSLQLEKHLGLITTGRNCLYSILIMKEEDGVALVPFAGPTQSLSYLPLLPTF